MDNNFNNNNGFDGDGQGYYNPQDDFEQEMANKMAQKSYSYANTSLICGIISIATYFLCCFCMSLPTLILGIIAMVYAFKAKNSSEAHAFSGKSTAGLVLGIIGIFLTLVFICSVIFGTIWMGNNAEYLNEIMKEYGYNYDFYS